MGDDTTTVTAYLVEHNEVKPSGEYKDLSEARREMVLAYKAAQTGSLTAAQAPNAYVSDYETSQGFALAGALAPPEDPRQVAIVYRRSSALRPCVEAIATNVCGFGHSFEPVVDLDNKDTDKRVREAVLNDRLSQGNETEPTDADVEQTRALIERESPRERFKLERFFQYVCPTMSFGRLRKETHVEKESGGNAYWEVVRRGDNSFATFDRLEAHTVRLRATETKHIDVDMWQRRSPLSFERVSVKRRFRTFVQIILGGTSATYFKEFGDPRIMSAETARYYATPDLMWASEGSRARLATEIIHWASFDTIGPYGIPPWYGAQYGVMGILASERVNYDYFDQKAIPPFAIFVSGGKLSPEAKPKLEALMKSIKGQGSFWKILVLEADSTGGPNSKCKIELHPLIQAMPEDALFQKYEENNAKKIQQQWRLPDLLVGRSEESNRAQAESALQMTEQQSFQPRRESDDDFFNRFILPEMGIRFWRFKTNSAVAKDPALQTEIGTAWVKAGVLTPNQGLQIAGEVFNKDFPPIVDPWGDIPQPLALAGIMPGVKGGETQSVTPDQESLARRMIALRDTLQGQAVGGAAVAETGARAAEAVKRVRVSAGDWDALWAAG